MDRKRLKLKIFGAAVVGIVLGATLVMLSLSYSPFLGPTETPQEAPPLLIGVTGFAVAVVAYAIVKLHLRKQTWS